MLSLCYQIRTEIDTDSTTSDSSHIDDTPVVEATAPSIDNSPATSSTVDALVQQLTPAYKIPAIWGCRITTCTHHLVASGGVRDVRRQCALIVLFGFTTDGPAHST